jgi:hypothetical protein
VIDPADKPEYDQAVVTARSELGMEAFATAYAERRAVIRHHDVRRVSLIELPLEERPPIIRQYLRTLGSERVGPVSIARQQTSRAREATSRHYFGLSSDASFEEIQAVVGQYPVFHIVEATISGPEGAIRSARPTQSGAS